MAFVLELSEKSISSLSDFASSTIVKIPPTPFFCMIWHEITRKY